MNVIVGHVQHTGCWSVDDDHIEPIWKLNQYDVGLLMHMDATRMMLQAMFMACCFISVGSPFCEPDLHCMY